MLSSFKRPQYTGRKRCFPCTVLNVVLLITISVLTAFISSVGAVILVIVGGLAIWFRGYFVPYTPRIGSWITDEISEIKNRELPSTSVDGSLATGELTGEKIIEELLRVDVLELTSDEDIALSNDFQNEWRAKMKEVRTLDLNEFKQWAETVIQDCNIISVDIKEQLWSDPYMVLKVESGQEHIIQYPVAVAEFSSIVVLEGIGVDPTVQLYASGPLRGFLTECSLCDTPLEISHFNGCCGSPRNEEENPGLVCKKCRMILFKYPSK